MTDFPHRQSAHCESGVVANMLTAHGLSLSEPMAFGLSASLAFAYLPMVKLSGMPLIAYRMLPGSIIKGVSRLAGVTWRAKTFSDQAQGMAALDAELAQGRAVGVQTGIYWLPYVPDDMRFHFNAHNLVVMRREGNGYLVSDPIFPETNICDAESLRRARFAKGPLAPKGRMYFPLNAPSEIDLEFAVPRAIRRNIKIMKAPLLPMVGVSGIRYMGGQIRKLARQDPKSEYLKAYLGHIVRMQEEIGTGGAGFRFIYAAFLKEAGDKLNSEVLKQASSALTDAGDEWRRFALYATKMCRGRRAMDARTLDGVLNGVADREQAVWRMLADV